MLERIAVISDVHGNIEALEAVLSYIDKYNPDAIAFLGDSIGICGSSNECYRLLSRVCKWRVMGEYDRWLRATSSDPEELSWGHEAIMQKVRSTLAEFIRGDVSHVEYEVEAEIANEWRIALKHGVPSHASPWDQGTSREYIDYVSELFSKSRLGGFQLVGHSCRTRFLPTPHPEFPNFWEGVQDSIPVPMEDVLIWDVGSVGCPVHYHGRAAFSILDTNQGTITSHWAAYDKTETAHKMNELGCNMWDIRSAIGRC